MNIDRIIELKEKYGEAFYVMDSAQFRQNYGELKEAFSAYCPNFNIAYSYKTNYTPKLCKLVNDLGGYAEVVSEMELQLAEQVGVAFEKIIWNGPIKSQPVLERFLLSGGVVNIDSMPELKLVLSLAQRNPDKKISIGLRCNYDIGDGVISRFGMDVDSNEFLQALGLIVQRPNIVLKQFQCHFATRRLEYWGDKAKGMLALIDRLGICPERVDLGGGLYGKMPESMKEQFSVYIPSYHEYAEVVAKPFAEYFADKSIQPELIIEPGSALVGDCMSFVGTVKSIKTVRGKWFATILASQKNISMGNLNPPMEVIKVGQDRLYYSAVDLVGYTCIEGDVLYHDYSGDLAVGDLVVLGNCGSYSLVMKPPFILPNFPVVDTSDRSWELVKQGETYDNVFSTFVLK